MRKHALYAAVAASAFGMVCQAMGADVVHRWSFTSGPNQLKDSVGTADVSLFNSATITDNQLDLTSNTGTGNDLFVDSWAEIPAGGTVDGLTNATIEGWLTWGGPATPANWHTAWSFGSYNIATNNYVAMLTENYPQAHAGVDSGVAGNDVTEPLLGAAFPVGQEVHFAVVYDSTAAQPLQLYTDIAGQTFVSALPSNGFTMAGLGATTQNYLGRDFFVENYGDVLWKGSINEMRIWDGAFNQAAFDADTALGPDTLPPPPAPQWAIDGNGSWGDTNSWTDHVVPTGGGTGHANFMGGLVTQNGIVTLDGNQSAAGLTFDNAAHSYTIAQGSSGTLTLGDGTVTATIDVNSGTHVISAPVALASNTTITVAASSAMNLTGAVSISGGKNITKAGPGSASIGGLSGAAGNIDQSAGTLNLSVDAGANLSANRVRLNGLSLGANASLTLNQGAGGAATASKVETLAMDPTATLNMKNNSMVINTGTLAAIRPLVVGGKIFGNANVGGAGTKATAIGYAAGNDPNIAGLNNSLAGQSFGAGSVLLKYTYVGDANLDGSVDGSDVALWAQNFSGALGLNPPNPRTWTQGDWNNDGSVDGSDVALWAQNFTGALGGGGLGEAVAAAGPAIAVEVPEPATLGLLAFGALGLVARRRRLA